MAGWIGWFWGFSAKQINGASQKNKMQTADALFLNEKYKETYDTLINDAKNDENVEILWRLGRVMYKMSQSVLDESSRNCLLNDAHSVLNKALILKEDDANANKWMAVILSAIAKNSNMKEKAKTLERQRTHLLRSLESNPNDFSVLHMMGNWCFVVSGFSDFQRLLLRFLSNESPKSTYLEAYQYFSLAEEHKKTNFIPNLFMLGKTCYVLKRYYKAKYYFELTVRQTPRSSFEESCQRDAKDMMNRLSAI